MATDNTIMNATIGVAALNRSLTPNIFVLARRAGARDHTEVFTGEVEIPVQPVHDITAAARQILDLDVVAQ